MSSEDRETIITVAMLLIYAVVMTVVIISKNSAFKACEKGDESACIALGVRTK